MELDTLSKSLQERCEQIEDILLNAARSNQQMDEEMKKDPKTLDARLYDMIDERRQARATKDKEREKAVSKRIRKEIKAVTIARKRAKI